MEYNEQASIIACQAGKLEEFGKLYDAYVQKIYRFIFFRTQHRESAEDITSQVFLRALKNIQNFNLKQGYFSAWLYRIARNSVIDYYRTRPNEAAFPEAWDIASGIDLGQGLDAKQMIEKVQAYLKKLKPEQREIITLRVWDGLAQET